MAQKYKILNNIERHNFGLNDLPAKSNRVALQIYRAWEERTFGTPCLYDNDWLCNVIDSFLLLFC